MALREKLALMAAGFVLIFVGLVSGATTNLLNLEDIFGIASLFVLAGIITVIGSIIWMVLDRP